MEEINMARITMTFYEMMNYDINFTAITAQIFETANLDSAPVAVYENFIREEISNYAATKASIFQFHRCKKRSCCWKEPGIFIK
jgi:hypothetical protein